MTGLANVVEDLTDEGGDKWCVSLDGSPNTAEENWVPCESEDEARRLLAVVHQAQACAAEWICRWLERDSVYQGSRETKAIRAGTYRLLPGADVEPDLEWPLPRKAGGTSGETG